MVDVGSQTFRDRRQTEIFFFVQIGFFSIKSPNSSRKLIKKLIFGNYEISTSFIDSKKGKLYWQQGWQVKNSNWWKHSVLQFFFSNAGILNFEILKLFFQDIKLFNF
jgi:hypothetical protein